MLEEAHFVYGAIRAEARYAGSGLPPPGERARPAHLWDITLKGPRGAAYTVREWSPASEKPDLMLLGAMVRSVIVGLETAHRDPERWRERMLSAFDKGQVTAALKAAVRFSRWLPEASRAALEDAARIEAGGRPKETPPGPKEWWPGV